MSITTSVADFLTGGGGKSAKFETIGDSVRGTVTAADVRQQTDLNGALKTWDDGNPMMQLVVTLQTDARDDADDDGVRNVYVKGAKGNPLSGTGALIAALKAAGASDLQEGGTLAVQYIGDGTPPQRGFSAPKQWKMAYKAPALNTGGLLDEPAPAPSAAAAPAPSAAATPPPVDPANDPLAL